MSDHEFHHCRAAFVVKGIALCGAGGFARETLLLLEQSGLSDRVVGLYESDDVWLPRKMCGYDVGPLSQLDPYANEIVLAVGDPSARQQLRALIPDDTHFPVLVHSSVHLARTVDLGPGSIICAGAVITCDIIIGKHVVIDRLVTVGHDCRIDDFVTLAPGAVISGNCSVGRGSYVGANASVRQKVTITEHAVVGMGAVVVSDIQEPGTYAGCPARLIG